MENIHNIKLLNDLNIDIALGNYPNKEFVRKFGKIYNLDTGDSYPQDVWEATGIYTGQPTTTAETLEIVSTSTQDSSGIGTGAWTVEISNLRDNDGYEMPNIVVSLDGTNYVSLGAQTYYRAARIKVITAGSGGANAGVLTLRQTTTTTNIMATVAIGKNQTNIMAYSVPTGKVLLITNFNIQLARPNGSAGSADCRIMCRPHGEVYQMFKNPSVTNQQDYSPDLSKTPTVAPARMDILFRIDDVSDNDTIIVGELHGTLITL